VRRRLHRRVRDEGRGLRLHPGHRRGPWGAVGPVVPARGTPRSRWVDAAHRGQTARQARS